jgi:GNAT superfamily N-acetyltransferase
MKTSNREIEFAIEVFARGHSAGRSRTFPYEVSRVGPLWLMRDALRKNPCDYRKEEWIAHDVDPREVDEIARQHTRGRFFVCAMIGAGELDESTRAAYKALGYRLLATEGFFVHRMKRIPMPPAPVSIERVRTPDLAVQLGKITRTRPISNNLLRDDAPFRQYVALDNEGIVGRVRSVDAVGATWYADMYVQPSHRRRGIGQALLSKMLKDDRARDSKCSVLTANHTGALLYPHAGYERIGTLLMFAPKGGKVSAARTTTEHNLSAPPASPTECVHPDPGKTPSKDRGRPSSRCSGDDE